MHWFKRDVWKIGTAIASILLLLLINLTVWIPVSAASAHEGALGQTQLGAITPTPTVNATAVAQDLLKQQDEQLQRNNSFPWTLLDAIGAPLVAIVALLSAGIGFWQWLRNRKDEQKKRDEDRFQLVVTGLGSKDIETRVGAAIMLRTFLRPSYKQFYGQAFDLAVAHLRLQRHTEPGAPKLADSLNQALTTVFKESYPRVRDLLRKNSQFLDSASLQLDERYLFGADLKNVWMPKTFLRKANLAWVDLRWANLSKGDLSGANLSKANLLLVDLSGANLSEADLSGADLSGADLSGADLSGADLKRTKLRKAKFMKAEYSEGNSIKAILLRLNLKDVNLSRDDLWSATFVVMSQLDLQKIYPGASRLTLTATRWLAKYANVVHGIFFGFNIRKRNREMATFVVKKIMEDPLFTDSLRRRIRETNLLGADLSMADLTEVNLNNISSLKETKMASVIGLTTEQRVACKAKGAIIDEDPTTSSSQPTASPSPLSQSNDAQTPSASSAQGSSLAPDADGSSATSSPQDSQS